MYDRFVAMKQKAAAPAATLAFYWVEAFRLAK